MPVNSPEKPRICDWTYGGIPRHVFVMFACFLMIPSVANACPNCKDALAGSHRDVAFAASILFMMATPFLLLAAWITMIMSLRKRQEGHESGHPAIESPADNRLALGTIQSRRDNQFSMDSQSPSKQAT